jgi:hypothetical protein
MGPMESRWYAFTATTASSTPRNAAGSSVALTRATQELPSVSVIRSPPVRMASRCLPRARRCTSFPALASTAPS